MAIMNQEETKTENKRINAIDDSHKDEELENQKMEMFFSLIKNYQQAKKRRRQELTQDSGDVALIPTKGSESGIVPVFRPEDFSHCVDLNLKPSNSITPPTSNQEEDKGEDEDEEEEQDKEEEEEAEKEIREDSGLDLNEALDNGLDLNLAL